MFNNVIIYIFKFIALFKDFQILPNISIMEMSKRAAKYNFYSSVTLFIFQFLKLEHNALNSFFHFFCQFSNRDFKIGHKKMSIFEKWNEELKIKKTLIVTDQTMIL